VFFSEHSVYILSNSHVTDEVLWGSMVGYSSDSLASCLHYSSSSLSNRSEQL